MTPKAQEKTDKLYCTKIKNSLKDTIKRVKRKPIEWEKICANHKSNKESHSE
jgi:hypothetical protein